MFTLAELLADLAPGVRLEGADDLQIRRACADSRECGPQALFAALVGERTNGHRYIDAALGAGAVAALVDRPEMLSPERREGAIDIVNQRVPARAEPPAVVVVPSVLAALQRLAQGRRRAHPEMRVVGVTGSVGKTTTKESIAAVLARRYAVSHSQGNQNNEIGLPLTLLAMEGLPDYAVLEMGMYTLGEIASLCEIAEPQIGVVTNVGPVHLERLGSLERIAQAKAELVQALPADGLALLNGDDVRVVAMRAQTAARVATFGLTEGQCVWADDICPQGLAGMQFSVHIAECEALGLEAEDHTLRVAALGEPAVLAALPAVALGRSVGLRWDEIQAGLLGLGHGLRLTPVPGVRGCTLLDDTYNASPAATCAALRVLADVRRTGGFAGRRIAVLADMLELGSHAERGHREVGRCAAASADRLITVGALARLVADEAGRSGLAPECIDALDDVDSAIALLQSILHPGDVVLVKGSNSMGMGAVVRGLAAGREDTKEAVWG